MSSSPITVEATLGADGVTLHLDKKLPLPPGRVTVSISAPGPEVRPGMLEVLQQIHQNQRERGQRLPTEEEMTADLAQRRAEDDEYEARWQHLWSQGPSPPPGPP